MPLLVCHLISLLTDPCSSCRDSDIVLPSSMISVFSTDRPGGGSPGRPKSILGPAYTTRCETRVPTGEGPCYSTAHHIKAYPMRGYPDLAAWSATWTLALSMRRSEYAVYSRVHGWQEDKEKQLLEEQLLLTMQLDNHMYISLQCFFAFFVSLAALSPHTTTVMQLSALSLNTTTVTVCGCRGDHVQVDYLLRIY